MSYPELGCFVDGRWITDLTAKSSDVINPANEERIAILPHADKSTMDLAVSAAYKAFHNWRQEPAAKRRQLLHDTARELGRSKSEIIQALSREQGKTLLEAGLEVDRSIETFEWFADEAVRIDGRVYTERNPGVRNIVLSEPVGVVAAFTPWNFPTFLASRKLAPALAAGCAVVLKGAEETPGSVVLLVKAMERAGIPAGVVNLLFGTPSEVSERLLASSFIRKVSFTGSVAVGKHIARLASGNLQRCTLELGGHSPMIVFPDSDVESTVKAAAAFKFRNAGQVCISPNRFYVHNDIYDRFVDEFTKVASELVVGAGSDDRTQMGPLANRRRLDAMSRYVDDAVGLGAHLAFGGRRIGNRGFFFQPTVLADVPDTAAVMREEPFGPIAPIASFADNEEVLLRANSLGYGLAAYVYTGSAANAKWLANRLEAGTIGINHMSPAHADIPMGGVKESGYGYEGGHEGLESYLVRKHVAQTFF